MDKNKNKPRNKKYFFDVLLEHRLASTIVIIIIYIFITAMIFFNFYTDNNTAFQLDKLKLSAEISSFLFIVVSSIIAVWQYYISCRNEQIKNKTEKVQKSIELIEYYKNNILNKISAIKFIFNNSGINNILNCIDKSQITNFDTYELEQLLTKDKLEQLKNIQNKNEFINAVLMANEAFNLKLPGITKLNEELKENDEKISKHFTVDHSKVIYAFMSNFIFETLNNLEYFSMYFTHNIAYESVIYQSTHQTYIEITELLYYHISKLNTPNSSKFYTNLIELYNIWKNKQVELQGKTIQEQRRNYEKGTYANDID